MQNSNKDSIWLTIRILLRTLRSDSEDSVEGSGKASTKDSNKESDIEILRISVEDFNKHSVKESQISFNELINDDAYCKYKPWNGSQTRLLAYAYIQIYVRRQHTKPAQEHKHETDPGPQAVL